MKINIINGPNLNLLGMREKNIYGEKTYQDLHRQIKKYADKKNIDVSLFQSNIEGEIINFLHQSMHEKADAIIINAGALSHYSYAIRDAIASINLPTIEIHLSNIYAREKFRTKSVIAEVCIGQVCGLGFDGYILAIDFLCNKNKIDE